MIFEIGGGGKNINYFDNVQPYIKENGAQKIPYHQKIKNTSISVLNEKHKLNTNSALMIHKLGENSQLLDNKLCNRTELEGGRGCIQKVC